MLKQQDFLDKLFKPFLSRNHRTREGAHGDDLESIAAKEHKVFRYSALLAATDNFSEKNKLGEGGFGAVYKGTLKDGRVVAVKRLSARSRQGEKEFKNEALLLVRVQHKNIVNLFGYCATGEDNGAQPEKLLVYEYIPRESLDRILFDAEERCKLDWRKRFDIIKGVARGLLYLHEDCHTTIIHRDIKASNILLDERWTPKIADFGMARLYPEDQTHVQTRVAGTNGYMAPEYLMHGQLSMKADVFSFGVLVLEIISGRKNSLFFADSDADSLLEWVWKLQRKSQSMEILDSVLDGTADEDQITTCVHIGLLCSQADPKLRPDMKRVVVMLSKKTSSLPEPTRPGFPGSRYRRSRDSGGMSSSAETGSSRASTPRYKSSFISTSVSNPILSSVSNAKKSSAASYQERHSSQRSL